MSMSQWYHSAISSSVIPFSSCHQSFPASGSFPIRWLFTSRGQSTRASASASVLPMNIQSWFHLALTGWPPCCSRNTLECSLAPQFKSINSLVLSLFYGPTLTSIQDYWKNKFWLKTFVSKVMSLLSNTLSMFVKVFLPKSKCLLISWLQSPSTMILEPKKIVCHGSHCLLIYLPWSDGTI